jgi:hypothetical protein
MGGIRTKYAIEPRLGTVQEIIFLDEPQSGRSMPDAVVAPRRKSRAKKHVVKRAAKKVKTISSAKDSERKIGRPAAVKATQA